MTLKLNPNKLPVQSSLTFPIHHLHRENSKYQEKCRAKTWNDYVEEIPHSLHYTVK